MSLNRTAKDLFDQYSKVLDDLFHADILIQSAFKYRDFYGEWGMIFIRYVTPYFWVLPLSAAILLIMTFKRQNLFGPMQKCLVIVIAVDVFFVVFIGFKDLIFNVLQWNHGIVEYKTVEIQIHVGAVYFVPFDGCRVVLYTYNCNANHKCIHHTGIQVWDAIDED
uniref:Uncharacterized protein n=1 Tax=Magallana gigas TaxID=29159 RepID=A0A8W8JIH5_MAGGI